MSTLLELAERCEKASGPDRELDRAIRDELKLPNDYAADWGSRGHEVPAAFPYTASLDAALALAPGNDARNAVFWRVGNDGEGGDPSSFKAEMLVVTLLTSKQHIGLADTGPLALCAAALRTKALTHTSEDV